MKDFKTKAIEDYGNIIVNVKEATTPIILQLYQGDKEIKVLEERTIKGDGKVIFDYLGEGTYMIRAILDRNGNGKWDTGNYLKHLQPEEIKYLPAEIKLKKNFDVEQDFDMSKREKIRVKRRIQKEIKKEIELIDENDYIDSYIVCEPSCHIAEEVA